MEDTLYERVFEEAGAGMAVHESGSARLESVNRAYAQSLGYDRSELEGQKFTDLVAGDASAVQATANRVLDGHPEQVETTLTDANGTAYRVTLEFETITVDGQSRLLSTIQSVSDQAAETAPSPSERRLEVALAGTGTGVWEWDMTTDEVIWTESMERLYGLEPGTFEGTFEAFAERVHPEDVPDVQAAIDHAVETSGMFQTEYRIEREDGTLRWVSARGEIQDDSDRRMIGIVTDITDRKENEQALRQQDRQYRQLVERLPQAHYTIDSEWRVQFCNQALADRLGKSVEEIEDERFWDVSPETTGNIVERTFRRVMETRTPENFGYQYESGQTAVNVQVYPYEDGIAVVSTDVSSQQEALLRILDAAPIALYRFDSDGVFQEVRGDILSRMGIEPEDLIGENIFEAYADHQDVIAAANRALDGESFRYTVSVGGITLETHYTPVYEDGEVTSVIGVSMDVSELHRQRERMEFFNSILRHDVLNGMTVIKMRAELLAAELDGEHAEYAQTIVDWCTTTTEVTKRVRRVVDTLTTPEEEHQLESIDVSSILDRKIAELEAAYPDVTFETANPDDVRVEADELLSEVLGNVLTNGIEHNDTDGLRLETSIELDGETVTVRIADNGQGIDDDRKETVFRRGETSQAKETGSGFGLFFADVMIEKYGGDVRIEDSEADGACFVIELAANGTNV